MPWKALKRLLEMQGIALGFEDSQQLYRQIKVKGDVETVNYKQALSYLQPNFELDDPIRGVWQVRKAGAGDAVSRISRQSFQFSASPTKALSIRSINNSPSQVQYQQLSPEKRMQQVPPIKKLVPGQSSPRQISEPPSAVKEVPG